MVLAWAVLTLAACEGTDDDEYIERPVEEIYNQAVNHLAEGEYVLAMRDFYEVDRQHPYSVWANRAQLMAAYAAYRAEKYDDAITQAKRYIDLHPGSRDSAYAYYMVAICYYEQITDVGRDQGITKKAKETLEEIVRRYPESEYARDARLKLDLTNDHLAGKEMFIGRYYLGQKQWLAAINRFRHVVEKYQTTNHVPEALLRLVEAYLSVGAKEEAQTAAAVLGYNYPGSEWYADAYYLLEGKDLRPKQYAGSWLSRTWKSLTD